MKKHFDNLPLMFKVARAPALVLACLLLVALYSQSTSREPSRTLDQLPQRNMTDLIRVAEVQERVVASNAMVMQSVAYAGANLKPEIIKSLDQRIASEFKATQTKIGELQTALARDPEAAVRVGKIDSAFKKYIKTAGDSMDMKEADLYTAAILMSTAEAAYGEARELLQEQFDV